MTHRYDSRVLTEDNEDINEQLLELKVFSVRHQLQVPYKHMMTLHCNQQVYAMQPDIEALIGLFKIRPNKTQNEGTLIRHI